MKSTRRGFITTAAGAVAFGVQASVSEAAVGNTDVLIALPGNRFYAVPTAELEKFVVPRAEFEKEEGRRAARAPRDRGAAQPDPQPSPTPTSGPRTAVMGVRG